MDTHIRIKTNYGTMTAVLDAAAAPATVANFMQYVARGFYTNTLFHRVIPGFMIQGGGLEPGMYLKATDAPIANEASPDRKNTQWTLAMARLPAPHSATSQFFINVKDNDFLDWKDSSDDGMGYCVFGHLTDGLDVAMTISEVATGERAGYENVPKQDVVIEEIVEVSDEGEDKSESGKTDTAAGTGGETTAVASDSSGG